ncbi:helix-turn-helix domain-containing protein [Glutamicibacter arilaitensis]|uniref:XRE family transcriptional regulator n=1 Tax=Glutamicibacter arilaitensis TaxID=256701 RepID=A0A4Y8TYN3_9MICC|nr:helix-turn-helix transcriptional regulator [Glutamicibacter arilaitensis]TFH57315.1 XRE family transcriptional regulator [Glutamicibacter arilaitensis]
MGTYTDKLPAATVEQLQAERGGKRLTYKQLAEISGLKEQSVMRYLTGKRDIPLHELIAMTEALGLTLGELFERATQRIK